MRNTFKKIIIGILTLEAKLVLKKYNPKIIGVTGNVGKTSTKDAIYTALSEPLSIRKNQKSFNSDIGVPLTILGLENAWGNPAKWILNIFKGASVVLFPQTYPKWLVLEVGADHPGDIKLVTKWLKPDIVVVTRIPSVPVHIEYFRDSDAVAEEKSYLLRALKPGGVAILNADDERVLALGKYVKGEVLHYSIEKNSGLKAEGYELMYEGDHLAGIQFRIAYDSNMIPVVLKGVVGISHVYPVLAAFALGLYLKMPLVKLTEAFAHHEYPPGRMNILKGIKNTVIIDDTYNSSPAAVEQALLTLKSVENKGKKIAVLGDMLELGHYSVDAHKKIGELVPECADVLLTVGVRARDFAEEALKAGMKKDNILSFPKSRQAGEYLEDFIEEGDVVLVKGSQSMRMEKTVKEILLEKDKASSLLVRQEKEWAGR